MVLNGQGEFITCKVECQYNKVFILKESTVRYEKVKADVKDIISTLCKYKGIEIINGTVCEDYIRLSILFQHL